jgi:hypothetical protein
MKTSVRLLIAATLVALASPKGTRGNENPRPGVAPITSLSFLEGTWKGTFEGERFETSYSSPAGGKVVSWSKGFSGEKAMFFELEVFEERGGSVVVTPYPDGNRAQTFTLVSLEGERAVFESPDSAFPRRLVYERVATDRLRFVVSGERDGKKVEWRVEVTSGRD